jgi:DNA polymerase-3 subunit gamma/tau
VPEPAAATSAAGQTQQSRPEPVQQTRPEPAQSVEPERVPPAPVEQAPVQQAPAQPEPQESGRPQAGGLDTAAIRRAWPDILAWIFKHKRTTWTLLSEHATVHEFDGRRVVLGISTVGIANTFRHGPHADLVRQALIDVLGVDARVEGIPVPDARLSAPSGESHPVVGRDETSQGFHDPGSAASSSGPEAGGGPTAASGGSGPTSSGHSSGGASPSGDAGGRAAAAYAATGAVAPTPESGDGGWASAASAPGSGPSWATEPAAGAPGSQGAPAVAVAPAPPGSLLARAKAEVAAEEPERKPETYVADDSAASDDDEDIEAVGDVGRPVIERILGGRVIDEG